MPWPLVVMGAIEAGTALYGAIKQSNAARSAAETQQQSGREALALQEKMWNQQQANLQPWVTQGQQAATALGSVMGLSGIPGTGGATAPMVPLSSVYGANASGRSSAGQPITGYAVPRTAAVGQAPSRVGQNLVRPAPLDGGMTSLGSYATTQTASSYVPMRAPDGTVKSVPPALVNHYLARGAQLQ